jgi:tetratricopeptide (TPR) repeat protein
MFRSRFDSLTSFCAAAGAILMLALISVPAAAQRAGADNDEAERASAPAPGESKVIPTIRTVVYDQLAKAQLCMDEDDLECATDELESVERRRDLNNYEIAQLWNFRAFIYFDQDNFEGAVEAYETILALPYEDMPDGMIQSSLRNLATLYIQLERYEEGLSTYQMWMALPTVEPSPTDYYQLASIYYQMDRYTDGIPAVHQAIELANERGSIGEESWYQLLYVFHYSLEQTDKVIETLTFMVENWTKKNWVLALAGQMSDQDRERETLTLYEAAYEAGWLDRGSEWVQLANLYLNGQAPYKAAKLLDQGLNDGTIESNVSNWRLLAQALQLAQEHQRAIPAFERASELSDDGEVDRQLVQSLIRLARWDDCVVAARRSLTRDLDRPDLVNMYLGQCLMTLKRYDEAQNAFRAARAADERSERDADRFLVYLNTLIARDRSNAEALASLQAN